MTILRPFAASSAVLALLLAPAALAARREPPPAPEPAPPSSEAPEPPATPPAGTAPAAPTALEATSEPEPPDPGTTPAEALRFFMASRDYHRIRQLRSIMTSTLEASYRHDPTRFNGKKRVRMAAFDYREPSPKASAKTTVVAVRSLWADQGEAVELRSEAVRLNREAEGSWRVAVLERTGSEDLRFRDAVPGVTALRMFLRAWQRRDLDGGRSFLSAGFLKRHGGDDPAIAALFEGDPSLDRMAFRIVSLEPRGATGAVAKVRLFEGAPDQPVSLEGVPKTLDLVKAGPRWLLDAWK